MHQFSLRGVVAALSRKAPRPGLGTAVFGARLLVAFALPSHLLAHEAHPPAQPATAAVLDEAPFLKENDAAMTKMMKNVEIKPTGDVDRDFVATMSPHYQGAIDMAINELRYGKNKQLRFPQQPAGHRNFRSSIGSLAPNISSQVIISPKKDRIA
jgi:Domain of unknown function (DUF305)